MQKHGLILLISIIIGMIVCVSVSAFIVSAQMPAEHIITTGTHVSLPTLDADAPSEPLSNIGETFVVLDTVESYQVAPVDLPTANVYLDQALSRKIAATNVYYGLLDLGYAIEHPAVIMAAENVETTTADYEYYKNHQNTLQELHAWEIRAQQYPEATKIWLYMKALGWSDEVCAGIMGNMMVECGGHTLKLKPTIYSPGQAFYGICQWHYGYYREIQGADLEAQCDFLKNTIEYEFKLFGHLYRRGMTYETFLEMTSPSDIAICFAAVYERCGSGGYNSRARCAEIAYAYFTN